MKLPLAFKEPLPGSLAETKAITKAMISLFIAQ